MKQSIFSIALLSAKMSLIALPAVISTQASAVEGLSANVAVSNNYLWRGITQTSNDAAVSGGIDYAAQSGFYAGTWASNANWAENMTYELDLYAGFSNNITEDLSYDVGYIYYNYDNDAQSDFSEVYVNFSYGAFSVGYNTLVDSDADGDFGDDTYLTADAEFEVAQDLTLGFHLGSYDFDAADDYIEYGVSLSKNGFTFTLGDTDLDGADGDVNFVISYAVDLDL